MPRHLTLCGIKPRAWTELVSASPIVIRFCYPCGFERVVVAEQDKMFLKIAPGMLRRFASSYWSKANGGCTDECPRCRAAARPHCTRCGYTLRSERQVGKTCRNVTACKRRQTAKEQG